MAHNTRSGGRHVCPGPTQPERSEPKRPPGPNKPNSRGSRPLGGEVSGKPPKPAKHSAGNNITTPYPHMSSTNNDQTQRAMPMRATSQSQRSQTGAAKTTANRRNVPGASRLQDNEPHIGQASPNKTQTTTTQRKRLHTHGPLHGEPNSEHVVYTIAQDRGQPTGRGEHTPTTAQPKIAKRGGTTTRTTSGCASAGCSAKEPTANKLTIRPRTKPCTNKTAAATTTRPSTDHTQAGQHQTSQACMD